MEIDASKLSAPDMYRLLTGIVVPRPIAWVTSMSPNSIVNAAPFSAFTWVSTDPAILGFSIGLRQGVPKDTARNIASSKNYVVNIADETLLEQLHLTADEFPPDVSELSIAGLTTQKSTIVETPRISDVPIAMECELHGILEFGRSRAQFVLGEVVHIHIREGLCVNGKIETSDLRPIARLGGPRYAKLGQIMTMERTFHIGPR
jgi:flavin reductase (DIM6/NTAB) family NADH-FMN oxidoreductase RutF